MTTRRETMTGLLGAGIVATMPNIAQATEPSATATGTPLKHKNVGPIFQHGYVVADAEKTALRWGERAGIGPFYIFEQPIHNYVFRGKPTKLTMRTAVSYWQDIQLEIIQQITPEETFYSESLRNAPDKLNHFAMVVPDIAAKIIELDAARHVVHSGGTDGGLTFTYLEHYLPDGTTLELMSVPPSNFLAFDGMKAICRSWDGTKPLRTVQDLMRDLGKLSKG